MESHRVFGLDEVEQELRAPLVPPGRFEVRIGRAGFLRPLDVGDQGDQRIHGDVADLEGAVLDRMDAHPQLLFRPAVTGLAGAVDVQQRAADVMVTDLHRAHTLVRHVAVGAGDARTRVHALVPHLELGMLRLERRRAGFGVRPVLEAVLFVVSQDLVGLQPLVPRIGEPLLGSLEVVLDVALAADVGAHLLACRVAIDVVVLDPLRGLHLLDPFEEARPRHAQLHRVGRVAIDARHRMLDERSSFLVPYLVHRLEALDQVAAAQLLVRHVHRGMTVHAGAGLLHDVLPLGERLVLEHVGMAALFAKVDRERIPGPHRLQPRILFEARLRHDGPWIRFGGRARHGFAPAIAGAHLVHRLAVAVVLHGEVLAPHRWIGRLVVQLHDAVERIPRFLLAREDVHQQRRDRDRGNRSNHDERDEDGRSALHSICPTSL